MPEARLEDSGSGLAPAEDGWFVVNVRDAEWWMSETFGSGCGFESREFSFPQFGINLSVLEPDEPNCLYHSEKQQEAFLVLSGECKLLVEGEERLLRAWDFFHCPPGTRHVFVGAGEGPCVVLMVRSALQGRGAALPGVGARRRLRRERGGGDARPEAGVRAVPAAGAQAAVVLGSPALGVTSRAASLRVLTARGDTPVPREPLQRAHGKRLCAAPAMRRGAST